MDNSQAAVECPRAEGAQSPSDEEADYPRAEGAETAEAEEDKPQWCDTGHIKNGCLMEEKVKIEGQKEKEEEEEKEMKKVLQHEDGPIPRPPWIWREDASKRMRAWQCRWGRMWSWP